MKKTRMAIENWCFIAHRPSWAIIAHHKNKFQFEFLSAIKIGDEIDKLFVVWETKSLENKINSFRTRFRTRFRINYFRTKYSNSKFKNKYLSTFLPRNLSAINIGDEKMKPFPFFYRQFLSPIIFGWRWSPMGWRWSPLYWRWSPPYWRWSPCYWAMNFGDNMIHTNVQGILAINSGDGRWSPGVNKA